LAGLAEKKPEKMEAGEWKEKQTLAAATIRLCLSDQVMRDRTKYTEGNLGQAGNSIHVEDRDDQVVSEAEVIWAEDARGVRSSWAHQCLQLDGHRPGATGCED
jgi:hypothetical protein